MSAYDITSGSTATGPFSAQPGQQPVTVFLNFANIGVDNTLKTPITGLVAGDTLKVLNIPKGTIVTNVQTTVLEAAPSGTTSTGGTAAVSLAVGDGASGTVYNTAISVSAAAGTNYYGDGSTGSSTFVTKAYTAQGYLLLTVAESVSKGKIRITIHTKDSNLAETQTIVGTV